MKNLKFTNVVNTTVLSFILFIFCIGCEQGPPKNSLAAQAQRGEVHFKKYCVSCHGDDGRGVRVDTLKSLPANLRTINSRRKLNKFPVQQIARMIDGTTMPNAHGSREMPVWGEVFAKEEELDKREIKGKVSEIIAYLISIQD